MGNWVHVLILYSVLQNPVAFTGGTSSYGSLVEQAQAEYRRGHFAQSEALFLAALRALPSSDQTRRARTLSDLGVVYANEDELAKAEQAYAESLVIFRRTGETQSSIFLLRNLAAVYSLERRDNDALRVLRKAVEMVKATAPQNAILYTQLLNTLGMVYYRQGHMAKAEKALQQALQMLPDVEGLYERGDLLNNLGAVYQRRRQFDKAERYFVQALKITEAQVGVTHPDLTFSLSMLAVLYTDTGRYAEAEERYQRALAILDSPTPIFETRIARLLHGLSRTYSASGRQTEADTVLSRATAIARRNVASHPDMVLIMEAYAARLKMDGKLQEAEALRREANRARMAAGLVVNVQTPF